MSEIWESKNHYMYCNEDCIKLGKQGSTWDNGDTWDNVTWDSSQLK